VNISKLFGSAQSVLIVLAGLVTLAETPGATGAAKKALVLQALNPALDALPIPGVAGDALKAAAKALAPAAIDLLVSKANQAGLLPSSSVPSSSLP
jgi:hypothetical protein